MNTLLVFLLISLSLSGCKPNTITEDSSLTINDNELILVAGDLDIPWGMAWLPDGGLIVGEKSGEIYLYKENKRQTITGGPTVYNRGQGGLMDIILHPQFSENGWIYISYSSSEGEESGGNTAIARYQLDGTQLINGEVLYKATPNTTKPYHFGSRMAFDNEGYLFFSIGDRGDRENNPQDISRDGGKVYRIHDDGRIPVDNPFYTISGAKKAVFSYGHRNPQGMVKHFETGEIWTHEHGPMGGDEINIIRPGLNYGWPVITYGLNYDGTIISNLTEKEGMEQPLYQWTPSIAPCGMDFIWSNVYPNWRGDLLVGSLKFQYLEKLSLENGTVVDRQKLIEGIGRVRNVKLGPDGYIYVAVEGKGIFKLLPKA